ncbi:hypothetical protein ACVRXQ_11145 [Streptococcus panodentis]|uniref:Lipoprotein n=1 Tax=Streptococcus panodentis TaxID=1581472 RepID=A0ABS5AYH4_9STRE|nr:hypothetical protein [Streptococcus panodentis]MBP2621632.1 hypothetical protein [Streptococcus panodentis]
MRQRKNLILFSLAGLILTSGLIWGILTYLKATEKIYSDRTPASIDSIQVFDDQKFVLVGMKDAGGPMYYGQDYVTTISKHSLYTGKLERPVPIEQEEHYQVTSYDLNSPDPGKEKKEFDLYQLLGKNSLYHATLAGPYSYYHDGTDYFVLELEKFANRDDLSDNKKPILFTASGELITDNAEAKIKELNQEPSPYLHKINWSRGGVSQQIRDVLEKYHMRFSEIGLSYEGENHGKVDISGTNFARLYPEVAKNMKNIKLLYFRPEQYNEQEWFDKLIQWFAPEGQDVIELYATDEQTGEKTQIHSYDEFVAWIAAHPEEEKTE